MDDLFLDAVRQLLSDQCTPNQVRAIESGDSPQAMWGFIEAAGFADALVPEAHGGAGLSLAHVFGVLELCGSFALPVPLAETMLARALLAQAGAERPVGSLALAEGRRAVDGGLRCDIVRLGRVADMVLVASDVGWYVLPVAQATAGPAAFCLDASLQWTAEQLTAAVGVDVQLAAGCDVRTLQACLYAAQLSGALSAVFQRTLQYANDRNQFGRPIGKFQAIQHQLAVMSEHVFSARMAAQLGCSGDGVVPDRLRVAVAKARASEAALVVAEHSHSIHGAIGFTEEYDLQLFTRRLHAWRQAAGSESFWHSVAGAFLVNKHQGLTLDLIRRTTD
jgi:acyl-CoA dehydrogenase